MSHDRQPTLFVSHPSTKADTALHIERALNARGVRCWIAPRDVEPGEQWDVEIRRAIGKTDAMLLLFCSDSERSKQVKRELILADQAHKAIIPMRLERIEPDQLSYHLADSQWIDWIEQRDEAIDRIAAKAREFQAERATGPDGGAGAGSGAATAAPAGFYAGQGYPGPAAPGAIQPPYPQPYPAPGGPPAPKSLAWLWLTLGGIAALAVIGAAVWWFALREPGENAAVTEQWFAGTWSDTRDCREMLRFDPGGALTWPDGTSGRWRIEAPNVLVMETNGEVRRRVLEVVANDEIRSPDGSGFRCL